MDNEFEVPNVNFIPCLKIVKKGVCKPIPIQIQLTRQELEDLNKILSGRLNVNEQDLNENAENRAGNRAGNRGQDEFDLEHYDDEGTNRAALNVNDIAVYDHADPYQSANLDLPDSEEDDDIIKSNDNIILVGHVERNSAILEVYVYNEGEGSFYVHHDYLLPSFPLALEWLDYDPGHRGGAPGSLCAVGSISPIIEVWDLDIVNCVKPAFKLGRKGSRTRGSTGVGHKDSVLDLSWNKHLHHILASGSADKTIMLWDLDKALPDTTLKVFKDKVQSLIWHPYEGQTLLAGSADKTCKVFDCKHSDSYKSWKVDGEVERVIWNHFNAFQFFSSDDKGFVHGFDCRMESKLWEISAHSKGVTGLSLSCQCPGLLSTASEDGFLKIWDVLNGIPELVVETDLKIGNIQCLEFVPDLPFVLAGGGDNKSKNLLVLDTMEKKEVKDRFQDRKLIPLENMAHEAMEKEKAVEEGGENEDQ